MVDAIVSVVLEQLISTTVEEAKERVRLVTDVGREVKRLRVNFEAIRAVMVDAEEKQWKEETVRLWLENLKHASYDMEDVLDEWNTARLKLKIEGDDHENPQAKKVLLSKLAMLRIQNHVSLSNEVPPGTPTVNAISKQSTLPEKLVYMYLVVSEL